MSIRDQLKKDATERIIYTAQGMLDGKIHIVEGSRLICKLRLNIDDPDPDDKIYWVFIMVKHETHDVPVKTKEGSKYNTLLIKASGKLDEYTLLIKPVVLKACEEIIDQLSESGLLLKS